MQVIPQHRTVYSGAKPSARRSTDRKRQTGLCSAQPSAHGFLNRRFLPLCSVEEGILPKGKNVERDFFSSLSILAKAYNFEPMDVSSKAYPYNVLLAHSDARLKIENADSLTKLLIIQKKGKTTLATKTVKNTGSTMFYIPVMPLQKLLKDSTKKQCAALLLSVFAYLYQVVRIPFYRDQSSYLYWQYQMIEAWLILEPEGWEESDFHDNMQQLEMAVRIGDSIKKEIAQKACLKNFEKMLRNFAPANDFESRCYALAKTAFDLFKRYPNRTVFDNMEDFGQDDDREDYYISAQQYISFIADSSGWLFENLSETINNEFNECSSIQEPVVWTVFDGESPAFNDGLDFETRLFSLIEDLCSLLYNIL
jgi:hypothetical protein